MKKNFLRSSQLKLRYSYIENDPIKKFSRIGL